MDTFLDGDFSLKIWEWKKRRPESHAKKAELSFLIYSPWNYQPKHLKIGHPKRKCIFQPPIFRCHVSFRECISASSRSVKMLLPLGSVFFALIFGTHFLETFKEDGRSGFLEDVNFLPDVWGGNCYHMLLFPCVEDEPTWMSRWKLGSMVSKWVITYL